MPDETTQHKAASGTDIPTVVIAKFLATLKEQQIPEGVVTRLGVVLLSDKKPTRKALADALSLEEPLP